MTAPDPSGENLTDDDLQYEIELVGDLVVARLAASGPLTQEEIDRLLGLDPPAEVGRAAASASRPRAPAPRGEAPAGGARLPGSAAGP